MAYPTFCPHPVQNIFKAVNTNETGTNPRVGGKGKYSVGHLPTAKVACAIKTYAEYARSMNYPYNGLVSMTAIVSLNIPEGVLFTDSVKQLENDMCFHE